MSHLARPDERAALYLSRHAPGVTLGESLGSGTDGTVFETSRDTALKACKCTKVFGNEVAAYEMMERIGVVNDKIGEFYVPTLEGSDESLLCVEMSLIHRAPYVLDFGKVELLREPEELHSQEKLSESALEHAELFGSNWPRVERLLRELLSVYNIYYADPKPGNIVFEDTFEEFRS